MSTMHAGPAHGLEEHGVRTSGPVHWNLPTAVLYEHAIRRDEGRAGGRRAARLPDRRAHRPVAQRQVRRARSRRAKAHVAWGKVNRPHRRGAVRRAQARHARAPRRTRALRAGPVCRRRPGLPAARALHPRAGLAEPVRPQPVHRAARRRIWPASRRSSPSSPRPSFKADPARHGTRSDVAIVAEPRARARC